MCVQQSHPIFGINQLATVIRAQLATIIGAQQAAQAFGFGQAQSEFGLKQPNMVSGIYVTVTVNNISTAYLHLYLSEGTTWPVPGIFNGQAQAPSVHAVEQIQEQHLSLFCWCPVHYIYFYQII